MAAMQLCAVFGADISRFGFRVRGAFFIGYTDKDDMQRKEG